MSQNGGRSGERSVRHEPGLRVLMIGPVPRIYGGISAVTGAILDSDLPTRCRLIYVAEGTRQGPLAKLGRFIAALLQASWLLVTRQADLMHLHVGDASSLYRHILYLAMGRLAGLPVLFHWHVPGQVAPHESAEPAADGREQGSDWDVYASGNRLQRWLIRWALRSASRVIVLSESWRPALERIIGPDGAEADLVAAGERRVVALPNPVDCKAIAPPAMPRSGTPATVLFLGDFSPRKGARDLLAAVPAVQARRPDVRFLVCGGQPPTDVRLQAAALDGAASFPGFVRGADKLRLLQEATVLALPSYAEGVPITLLEAMAAGLPVVITPVGGIPDVVEDGRNGLLVPPGDVPALAAALNCLLDDAALRERMGAANRQKALAEFDVPIYVARLLALYQAVA